jgi:hypothetical protein
VDELKNRKLLCIKSVVMDVTGEIAFTEGKEYEFIQTGIYINSINDQKEVHGIGKMGGDEFIHEHFKVIYE